MPRLMVSGATGFIGWHLCQAVGDCYKIIRHLPSESHASNIVVQELDETVDWTRLIPSDVECIVHLAGIAHNASRDEDYIRRINVKGTLHLAKQAALSGVKRFVFVSSIGVNGKQTAKAPFSPFDMASPSNSYTRSKYEAELGLQSLAESMGFELVVVRPTLVYGPDAPGNFGLLSKVVKTLPVLPFGLANNKRDFIAVKNLADFLITCAYHPDAVGHTFLASDGEAVSIKNFTNAVADGLGKKIIQLPVPIVFMKFMAKLLGKSEIAEQLLGDLQVDSSNIQKVLGWTPPFTMKQAMASLQDKSVKKQ